MTVDEIKQTYSMRDVLSRYGLQAKRDGMISCPFHGEDRHASMKVYKDSFHCFACGVNGDIFTFIQKMDNCDFKTAFYQLGGEYVKDHKQSRMAQYHAQKAREKREREERKLKTEIRKNDTMIHATRELMKQAEEGSDEFWDYLKMHHDALIKDENIQMKKGGMDN